MADEFDLAEYALCSFSAAGGQPSAGLAIDGKVIALRALANVVGDADGVLGGSVFDALQRWDLAWPLIQKGAAAFRSDPALQAKAASADLVRLHAPVETPGTIFCAGANYRKHLVEIISDRFPPDDAAGKSKEELRAQAEAMVDARVAGGEPFFFIKNLTSLNGPFDDIPVPALATQTDWELELGVVIGKRAWCVSEAEAMDHVAGYVIAHDVSTRDRMYRKNAVGADFIQAKGLPGFCPLGPYVVPKEFVPNPHDVRILLKLNGQPMQDERTTDMLVSIQKQIAYLSQWVPLEAGDVLATGSPAGNGTHYNRYLQPGDVIEGSITGLGTQRNHMVADQRP